jgi:hypothetical protein
MAVRPIFVVSDIGLVEKIEINFTWYPGFSLLQKQKSITALHLAASIILQDDVSKFLELSSKSTVKLGIDLSAFNLNIPLKDGTKSTVESVFQGSKVFEKGGPFKDLIRKSSLEAKKDSRIRSSGRLLKFNSNGLDWPLDPPSAFYDWLYMNALHIKPKLADQTLGYRGFTDIEFNPKKQLNCQAYSVALYASLRIHGLLEEALRSPADYLACMVKTRIRI